MMHLKQNLSGLLVTLFLYLTLQTVFASPIAETSVNERSLLRKRYSGTPSGKVGSGGPDSSDYPSDDDIRNNYVSPNGPSVFFSAIGPDSTPAYNFAQSKGGVIFRQAFTSKFTIKAGHSDQWYQDFADRFSGVFAEKASGDVYVVSNWAYKIEDCRVWTRIEYPSLQNNPDVTSVILVDYTNWANQKVIWTPLEEFGGGIKKRSEILEKRGEGYCFDWDMYGEDPADPDADPSLDIGYYPGSCGVHIVQYQKNEGVDASTGGNSDYRFDITMVDDQGEVVGGLTAADGPTGVAIDVDSKLPYVFEVTAGAVDSDPVSFAYAGQTWTSDDGQCSMGAYDSGARNGDCSWTC